MDERQTIMARLVRRYAELSALCYRAATSPRDEYGRFQRGRVYRRPHSVVLKKIDLDVALERVYQRFFGVQEESEVSSISTSNSRRHGSDTFSSTPSSCSDRPITPG